MAKMAKWSLDQLAADPPSEWTPRSGSRTPGQQEAITTLWSGERVEAGSWSCTPGEFPSSRVGRHEVAVILSGTATVIGADGEEISVSAGDAIVLGDGWEGVWIVHETIRKLYLNVDLSAGA